MSEAEYREMFYNRILGVLKSSSYFGYEDLVLGAWGCGAFGNDEAVVSKLFHKAMEELSWNGLKLVICSEELYLPFDQEEKSHITIRSSTGILANEICANGNA